MKKQIEIKWNEDENGKDQIKVFVDNELIVTQHSLSAVALAEVLCKVGCEVYISSQWMKNYIDIFWNSCLRKGARCLTIFSVSPLHLHSYFLIKKTKKGPL